MKSTPAQIEAADRAYFTERAKGQPPLDCMNSALTAAAEVARQGRVANWGHPAAAEVGEESTMEHIARDIKAGIFPRKSEPPLDATTIERCAWTVEIAWPEAAAAIRELKDK